MATKTRKRRRSAKQKANDKRLGAMARARHRGKATKTRTKRRARRASKAAASHAPTRTRRRRRSRRASSVSAPVRRRGRRRGRRAGARAKHRAKHRRRGKSRGRHRKARRSRTARVVFMNPRGTITRELRGFAAGITHVSGNAKAAFGNGITGYAAAAGGAVGAVFLGTFLARFVMPFALKTMPSIAANPIGARVLSFGLYYTGAYAIARFTPGLKQSTRDAIMFGGLVASVLEIVKPGIIARAVSYIPGVGDILAPKLAGIESELSDYVETALNGLGYSSNEYDGSQGFHGTNPGFGRSLSELSNYAMGNYAMGAYQEMDGLGAYEEMSGLGCEADPAMGA